MEKDDTKSQTLLLDGISRFIATVIWPVFGLIVILIFRRQFSDLIGRIKSIEILGKNKVIVESKLAPTPSAQQTAKSSRETEEATEAEPIDLQMLRPIRRNALLAEDLALRALQDEYGTPIRRQVTAGADPGFDGAFVSDDRLYIVEVKYYRSSFLPDKLRSSIASLSEAITRYGWSKVHIVLAAVFDELDDAYTKTLKLNQAVASSNVPVIVRTILNGRATS